MTTTRLSTFDDESLEEIFEDVDNKHLWITHLALNAMLGYTTDAEAASNHTYQELTRRYGEEANDRVSEFFTLGRFTPHEMLVYVDTHWDDEFKALLGGSS